MPLTKKQKGIGIAGVAVGGLFLWWLLSGGKRTTPQFFVPGTTNEVVQGGLYTLRLPRGRYSVIGDADVVDQVDIGVNTDVIFAPKVVHAGYTANLLFVDDADTSQRYELTIIARKSLNG